MIKLFGIEGTVTTDESTLDVVVGVMQDMDPNYQGVTLLGRCSDTNVFCDCLRCAHKGLTILQYTHGDMVDCAYVVRPKRATLQAG